MNNIIVPEEFSRQTIAEKISKLYEAQEYLNVFFVEHKIGVKTFERFGITTAFMINLIDDIFSVHGEVLLRRILPEKLNPDNLDSFFGKFRSLLGNSVYPLVHEINLLCLLYGKITVPEDSIRCKFDNASSNCEETRYLICD